MAKKATKKKAATPPKTEAVDQEARKALLQAVKEDGSALEYADKSLKADREVVLAAVTQEGYALEYATKALKADREIVLAAVKQDAFALQCAAKTLKADREIVLAAVKLDGRLLEYAAKSLQGDREIVFAAVMASTSALQYADKSLKSDREIVLAAVKKYGPDLEYAAKSLRADREIVLAAVKNNYGAAFADAAKSLRADHEIVLVAAKQDSRILKYADESLKADGEFMLNLVKQNGSALEYADESLKADDNFMLALVKGFGPNLQDAPHDLRNDREFMLRAVKVDSSLLKIDWVATITGQDYQEPTPDMEVSGPELTYYESAVKEKDINSVKKIGDYVSNVIGGGEDESTAHLVLGRLKSNKGNTLDEAFISIEHPEGDAVDFGINNNGNLISKPNKGEVVFVCFYYYDHSLYSLQPKDKFKKIGFESKSFYGEAVLTERNYPGFELVAEDASGGGEFRLNVYCDDGQSIEGTVEDKEELINELFDYLVEKGAIKEK